MIVMSSLKVSQLTRNNQQYEPHIQCFEEEDCYIVDVLGNCFDIFIFFRYDGDKSVRSVDASLQCKRTLIEKTTSMQPCIR